MSRWSRRIAVVMLLTAFVALYGRVSVDLIRAWTDDGNYSHGFLALPIAALLAQRRLRGAVGSPAPVYSGLIVASCGILLLAAGTLAVESTVSRVSMLVSIAGTVAFVFGWPRARMLLFPLFLILLAIPIPALIFNAIALPLQLAASHTGETILSALSVPVVREGNLLVLASTTLEVAEACSGIRSLMSLMFVAVLTAHLTDGPGWARLAIVTSSVPVAVIVNGLRVAATALAANRFGAWTAVGVPHAIAGWLAFVGACVLIASLARALPVRTPRWRQMDPVPC